MTVLSWKPSGLNGCKTSNGDHQRMTWDSSVPGEHVPVSPAFKVQNTWRVGLIIQMAWKWNQLNSSAYSTITPPGLLKTPHTFPGVASGQGQGTILHCQQHLPNVSCHLELRQAELVPTWDWSLTTEFGCSTTAPKGTDRIWTRKTHENTTTLDHKWSQTILPNIDTGWMTPSLFKGRSLRPRGKKETTINGTPHVHLGSLKKDSSWFISCQQRLV